MRHLITKSKCACAYRSFTNKGIKRLKIPSRIGYGDTLADWIHKVLKIKPCAACQKRRRILNILFPYVPRDSLQYRAWNDYLKSGLGTLPVIWDSDTGEVIRPD